MVVEHDAETMMAADWLVDVGPGAGNEGGRICYNGPVSEIEKGSSTTLDYLLGRKKIEIPSERRKGNGLTLGIRGARGNNLKNVDVDFPLGMFIGLWSISMSLSILSIPMISSYGSGCILAL